MCKSQASVQEEDDAMNYCCAAPVALLVFNRPEQTARVLHEIARVQPPRLLVVADDPRPGHPEDVTKCGQVRDIIEQIDWKCDVLRNYADSNMGCRMRVSSGLDWVFSMVDEAIILEDDCLPSISFFRFCEELLALYRSDSRIMQVCGTNRLETWECFSRSYFFSKFGPVWGWASWKRAWDMYDVSMKLWPDVKGTNGLSALCDSERAREWREKVFGRVYREEIDTWDYQWAFAKLINSGLSIVPSRNLISNIGFGADATHTTNPATPHANVGRYEIDANLSHPAYVLRDVAADAAYFERVVGPSPQVPRPSLASRAYGGIRKLLR